MGWALLDCGGADGVVEGMMRSLEKGSRRRCRTEPNGCGILGPDQLLSPLSTMAAAPLGSAAIGAAVSFGTTLYNNEKGFSARHEQCYDFQTGLTQRLVEGFTRAHRDGEVDDEDHEKCISLRDK